MSAIALGTAPLATKPAERHAAEQRFLLHGVDWATYAAVCDAFVDRPGLRITYDRGSMEFMIVSTEHEAYKSLLQLLVPILAVELRMHIKSLGGMTMRKEEAERGLEPDACFYVANCARMRGVKRFDPAKHPPPDLALEVDVSRSSLDRLGIYAALGVSEVWRLEGNAIKIYRRGRSGKYKVVRESQAFPGFPIEELLRFMRIGHEEDDTTMILAFQEWVRGRQEQK